MGVGRWIDDNIVRKVGDNTQTLFWWDQWIDCVAFRSSFNRIFDLADNKMAMVTEMYILGWGEDGGAWKWRLIGLGGE